MPLGYDLEQVRADIPASKSCHYLNTGTLGPSPRRVTERFIETYESWEESYPGQPGQYGRMSSLRELIRPRVARFIGARPEEIALTANSSDGINIVAGGLDFAMRDEVIISDQEHPAVYVPWLHLASRGRLAVRLLRLADDPAATLANLEVLLSRRTRLVCVSHVSSMTGLIVPAAEISSLAHAAGALVCFDGAQAAGQIPVNVAAIGSDFYVLNGHKWQLGPVGTGALYVRGAALEQLTPCASGGGSASGTSYPRGLDLTWKPDASKFEFGTRNWAVHAGWAEALDYLEQVGPGNARRHQLELGADLRRELGLVRGVTVLGPADPAWQTGLISFRLEGKDPQELCARLWEERHIATRPVGELGAVRASVAFFTAPEDVEALVRAVRDFAAAA